MMTAPATKISYPRPERTDSRAASTDAAAGTADDLSTAVTLESVAALMDLVADARPLLFGQLTYVFLHSEPAARFARELKELIADCGIDPTAGAPCRRAMAIRADLETLLAAEADWSHPAQLLHKPAIRPLHRLCAARLERTPSVAERTRLLRIHPRLERLAELEEKAATRRNHRRGSRSREPRGHWLQSWL
jgi:hypothetical protein